MKTIIARIIIISVACLLIAVDFNTSAISRIDSLTKFSQSIRNYASTSEYSASVEFPYNVPSYLATHMTRELNKISEDTKYVETSLNPTNIEHLANKVEASVLLNSDGTTNSYRAHTKGGRIYLTRYDPIMVKSSCLQCHGRIDDAPMEQIRLYGKEGGYGFEVGDVYGLKVISVDITGFVIRYVGLAMVVFIPMILWVDKYNQRLDVAMNIDSLSGALNKNYYLKTKNSLGGGYFFVFDIDDFKKINDTYGHTCGDLVIKQLCDILRSNCRESDMLFRFGGEEFILFAKGMESESRATSLAADILSQIRSKTFGDQCEQFSVTVSIGICYKPNDVSATEVMTKADMVMYEVKKNGKNDYAFAK